MMMKNKPNIDINKLKDLCCRVFEVNIDDLLSAKRQRNIVDARRAFFFLLKTEYKLSELTCSRLTGGSRDHSTLIYLNETTRDLLQCDYHFSCKYKLVYESFTLSQYVKPLPNKPAERKDTKHQSIFRYYTDDMLAKSRTKLETRMKYISDDYKKAIIDFMNERGSVTATSINFEVSRNLVEAVIREHRGE